MKTKNYEKKLLYIFQIYIFKIQKIIFLNILKNNLYIMLYIYNIIFIQYFSYNIIIKRNLFLNILGDFSTRKSRI